MKILHTGDWHLGHTLYNYDRTEEQTEMLRQMVECVAEEKPDLFLLCGDVFHTGQPSASVQTMLSNALVALHEAHPQMTIVSIAGNHDSGSKHDIFQKPWRALKVFTLGSLQRDRLEEHIIELPGRGFVVAVPYTYERNLPEGIFQLLLDKVAERNKEHLPVVMAAHTTVRGCDYTGHEESIVGGIDALEVEQFGQGYDYLALGHIHRPQYVRNGSRHIRYAGSPLPVSFDESYSHSVSVVELKAHGDTPQVRCVEIANPRPLVTLPTSEWASWKEAKELLKNFPPEIPAYIQLKVAIEDFLPVEAQSEAVALTSDKACRFCHILPVRKEQKGNGDRLMTIQEFQSLQPIDIARQYAEDINLPFSELMETLFKEAAEEVKNNV